MPAAAVVAAERTGGAGLQERERDLTMFPQSSRKEVVSRWNQISGFGHVLRLARLSPTAAIKQTVTTWTQEQDSIFNITIRKSDDCSEQMILTWCNQQDSESSPKCFL